MRQTVLYLSNQAWLRRWMEHSTFSRKLTSRFIAGRTLEEEVGVVRRLQTEGLLASLDFLGENVRSLTEAEQCCSSYLSALRELEAAQLPATVSVKLTQVGLDFSVDACLQNVDRLVAAAARLNTRVEIDMEASEYTERTLHIVSCLQNRYPGHVRAVIQAYLFRSKSDIEMLSALRIPIRLCKGAYREPPSVAFQKKSEVDDNYLVLMELLLAKGTEPAIASHDERMIRAALALIRSRNLTASQFEFQMLYGIRRDLQRELVTQGFRLRLYVPYGDAWYPYFMRRLAERPANILFLARNLLRP